MDNIKIKWRRLKRCPKCNTIVKRTRKEWINFLVLYCFAVIGMTVVMAPVAFYLVEQKGVLGYHYDIGENNPIIDTIYNMKVGKYQKTVRDLTLDLTYGCGSDDYCYFAHIYTFLKPFRYVYPEASVIYPPLETIRTQSFDCKNSVITFCSMMRSVGRDCYWSMNRKANHVVALAYVEDDIAIVDLSNDYYFWIDENPNVNNTDDFWKIYLDIDEEGENESFK